MTLAYMSSVYPRASDWFIRCEVWELRKLGHTVYTYSNRPPEPEQLVSDRIAQEHKNTLYLAIPGVPKLLWSAVAAFFRSPLRMLSAIRLAICTRTAGVKELLRQFAYLLEASLMAEHMRLHGIQHIHNHGAQNAAFVVMLASRISGIPYSLTIHGPYIFQQPYRWHLGRKISESAFTACITDFTRSQCMNFAPYQDWHKLHVVRCGPQDRFLNTKEEPIPTTNRLLWVGRICEEKGVPILIDAAHQLDSEGLSFELILVGDGPLKQQIAEMVERYSLKSKVRLLGWLSSDDVLKQIIASKLFVMPSFAEGLPMVLMEAMALQRPVIGTCIAGIPELIVPGKNGWLVPPGSVEALSDAMRDAITSPMPRIQEMGRQGAQRVLERHNYHTEVAKIETMFRSSLA